MPRRPRVEEAGYHHIINRGVARGDIFLKEEDYETFLEIVRTAKERYDFTLHSFCLMRNHYHLLIETKHNNLSLIARQINSKYAQYFNKEYKRVGPLWQGRFKNYFVYDEAYLYILFRYIEQNPIAANVTKEIGEYRWCASTFILNNIHPDLTEGSELINKEILEAVGQSLNDDEQERLEALQKTKYQKTENDTVRLKQIGLEEHFKKYENKKERNKRIMGAFKDGYTQSEIARYLGMTGAGVSYVINNFKFDT